MTQESRVDGIGIVDCGHVIIITASAVASDGNAVNADPGLDVEILMDENGDVEAKIMSTGQPSSGTNDEKPAQGISE